MQAKLPSSISLLQANSWLGLISYLRAIRENAHPRLVSLLNDGLFVLSTPAPASFCRGDHLYLVGSSYKPSRTPMFKSQTGWSCLNGEHSTSKLVTCSRNGDKNDTNSQKIFTRVQAQNSNADFEERGFGKVIVERL